MGEANTENLIGFLAEGPMQQGVALARPLRPSQIQSGFTIRVHFPAFSMVAFS